jgi:hypothetical protein
VDWARGTSTWVNPADSTSSVSSLHWPHCSSRHCWIKSSVQERRLCSGCVATEVSRSGIQGRPIPYDEFRRKFRSPVIVANVDKSWHTMEARFLVALGACIALEVTFTRCAHTCHGCGGSLVVTFWRSCSNADT